MGKRKTDEHSQEEPGTEPVRNEPKSARKTGAKPREQLRALREKNGLTQKGLADKVGVSSESVYFWEKGRSTPFPHYRSQLGEALHISLEEVEALLAESHATDLCWMVPYARNNTFTGRQALLEALYTTFQTRTSTGLLQAITGLGGIGKTQLVVEYAYRFAVDRPIYKTVLWASASSREELFLAYTAIAKNLSLIGQKQQDQQKIVEAVKRWLTSHNAWLFILDNVEDLSLVQAFLPQGKEPLNGQVLLTTRLQAVGPGNINLCEVKPLERDESMRFLLQRARLVEGGQPANQADQDAADRLCQELAGLPLALDQAGAYIEETGCTIQQYAQRYQEQRTLLRRRGARTMQVLHPEPVSVTFLLSLAKIEQASPAAADLLRFCAFLAPDAIPEDLLSRCRQSDARKHTEGLPVTLQELAGNPSSLMKQSR